MDSPVYEEKQTMQFRGAILILVVGSLVASGFAADAPMQDFIWIGIIGVFLFLLMWSLLVFRICITETELKFGYPFWHRRIPLGEVRVGDVESIPIWAGIGIHYWSGRWVYNGRLGQGVRIRSGKCDYLVGSLKATEFQNALLGRGPLKDLV
jgi:hypothetical protein